MARGRGAASVHTLQTDRPHLRLQRLVAADAPLLHRLVAANVAHLTRHGDYRDLVAMSRPEIEKELSRDDGNRRFGMLLEDQLIGRLDLIAVDPPRYGIGYWVSEQATGQGYAAAALRALIDLARRDPDISDLYAGVSHDNLRSSALLRRVGFEPLARFETYARFHLALEPM